MNPLGALRGCTFGIPKTYLTHKIWKKWSNFLTINKLISTWRRSGVFTANFEHISQLVNVSIVNFEQVNNGWVDYRTKDKWIELTIWLYIDCWHSGDLLRSIFKETWTTNSTSLHHWLLTCLVFSFSIILFIPASKYLLKIKDENVHWRCPAFSCELWI